MAEIIQPSFAKGEVAPELFGRTDTAAYQIALATARNVIVHTYGGLSNRPGLKFLGPVADHLSTPRLQAFKFKTTDTYILEFGSQYMRVIRDNGYVVNDPVNITGATQADPVVITANAHGYSNNDEVYISGVSGMTELNDKRYYIANVTTNTFELTDQVTGTDIDGTGFSAYTSGGTVQSIFELETPYLEEDLFELNFTQSADIMSIVHPDYQIRELSRTDHNAWSLDVLSLAPEIDTPADQTVTVNTAGSRTDRYRVTAIDRDTGEESLPGLNDVERAITGITQADPGVVTSTAHGFADGDEVQLDNVVGMTEVNTQRYFVANQSANTFELTDVDGNNIDTTDFTAYSSGGIARQTFVEVTNSNDTQDNTISWTAVTNAERYAVYRRDNGLFGLLGETELTSFDDENNNPDTSQSPPIYRNPFAGEGNYPGAVGYYEQRRVFGGSTNKPDTSEYSQIGIGANFNRSNPTQADDAISATLSSREVNEIRHYVALNDLLVFTSGAEWRVNAGADQGFSVDTIRQRPQSEWGSSKIPPCVIGSTVLFLEENQGKVRSLGYSLQKDGYVGVNLNVFSQHLLKNRQVVDWSYSKGSEPRIWMVLDDGTALSLTFDPEQEMVAWTRHDTDGEFRAVEALRSDVTIEEDDIYFVVERRVNGNTVRYIERMREQYTDEVRDCFFVDSGLSLRDPYTITNVSATDPVVVTVPGHTFSDGDEVDIFDIVWAYNIDTETFLETQPDQLNTRRYTVANSTATTFELTDSDGNDIDGTGFNTYLSGGQVFKASSSFSGMEHLAGREIICLADGNVITGITVGSDGTFTLPRKFSRVHAGLRMTADVETLDIEIPSGGETLQSYDKFVPKVTVRFAKSRGLLVGPNENQLVEMKQREFERLGDPTSLLTGDKQVHMQGEWNLNGRVWLRQKDPLPMNILAIITSVEVGEV